VIADMPTTNTTTSASTASAAGSESESESEAMIQNKARARDDMETSVQHEPTQRPHILLLKQFRPPLDRVCIEIPAGLIDEGESPHTCALRELKEETGYTGSIVPSSSSCSSSSSSPTPNITTSTSPTNPTASTYPGITHFNDPGFTNTATHLIHVRVDLSHEGNKAPGTKTRLEENEHVDAFWVPVSELYARCVALEREEGYAIDARVGTLAEGIEMARRLGLGMGMRMGG